MSTATYIYCPTCGNQLDAEDAARQGFKACPKCQTSMEPPPIPQELVDQSTTAMAKGLVPSAAQPAVSARPATLVFVGLGCAALGLVCGWGLAAARLAARAERRIDAVRSEAAETEAQFKAERDEIAAKLQTLTESLSGVERERDEAVRQRGALQTELDLRRSRESSRNVPPAVPRALTKWRAVARFSGADDMNTKPFQISAPRWRLRWTRSERPAYSGVLQLYIHKTGESLTEGVVGGRATGKDDEYTYEVGFGQGTYSLEIHSVFLEWSVVVEEAVSPDNPSRGAGPRRKPDRPR